MGSICSSQLSSKTSTSGELKNRQGLRPHAKNPVRTLRVIRKRLKQTSLVAAGLGLLLAAALAPDLPSAAPLPHSSKRSASDLAAKPSHFSRIPIQQLHKAILAGDRQTIDLMLDASAADAPLLHEYLHRTTEVTPADYRALLRMIGALVPDRNGRFTSDVKDPDLDWYKELSSLKPSTLSARLRLAYNESLLSVLLIRSLAATRHPDASISLLRFAYRHRGAFRDECGRYIRAMRVYAVPGLLRARALKDPLAYKMVRYAAYQLDRIDYARPDRVMKQAPTDLQVDILHAYGEVRDPAAVSTVLTHTASPSDRVRQAARWAMLRYVSGRAPKVLKRKWKLAGGRESENARALYLTYRQLARHSLVRKLTEELSRKTPGRSAGEINQRLKESETRYLAEQLFAILDRKRQKAVERRFLQGLEAARHEQLSRAIETFKGVLSEEPYHPRRDLMASAYYLSGKQLLEKGDHADSARMLTQAIHLCPSCPFVADAKARRSLAEARMEQASSHQSMWNIRAALKRAPGLPQAKEALVRLRQAQNRRFSLAAGAGGGFVVMLLIGLVRLRRRRTHT